LVERITDMDNCLGTAVGATSKDEGLKLEENRQRGKRGLSLHPIPGLSSLLVLKDLVYGVPHRQRCRNLRHQHISIAVRPNSLKQQAVVFGGVFAM
jgi:hypothetical protein